MGGAAGHRPGRCLDARWQGRRTRRAGRLRAPGAVRIRDHRPRLPGDARPRRSQRCPCGAERRLPQRADPARSGGTYRIRHRRVALPARSRRADRRADRPPAALGPVGRADRSVVGDRRGLEVLVVRRHLRVGGDRRPCLVRGCRPRRMALYRLTQSRHLRHRDRGRRRSADGRGGPEVPRGNPRRRHVHHVRRRHLGRACRRWEREAGPGRGDPGTTEDRPDDRSDRRERRGARRRAGPRAGGTRHPPRRRVRWAPGRGVGRLGRPHPRGPDPPDNHLPDDRVLADR